MTAVTKTRETDSQQMTQVAAAPSDLQSKAAAVSEGVLSVSGSCTSRDSSPSPVAFKERKITLVEMQKLALPDDTTEIYSGEVRKGRRHGHGCLKTDKKIFDGAFIKGILTEGRLKYEDGTVYTGSFKRQVPDGKGRITFPDGSTYTGEFELGEPTFAIGATIWAEGNRWEVISKDLSVELSSSSGEKYKGDIALQNPNGIAGLYFPCGTGTYTCPSKDPSDPYIESSTYVGPFVDRKPHGTGKLIFSPLTLSNRFDSGTCAGNWLNGELQVGAKWSYKGMKKFNFSVPLYTGETTVTGKPRGTGNLQHNGHTYIGEFQTTRGITNHHGTGTMTYANGDVYEGEWVIGNRHGKGKMTYASGTIYEGEWVNGNRHGEGTMTYASGTIYEGEWVIGNRHGKGKMTYASGTIYEGEWVNGNRHGEGTMTYANGDVYKGEWHNGEKYGKGTLVLIDGHTYHAEDQSLGRPIGTITYPDGRKYEGKWTWIINFQPSGPGKMTYPNGDVYEGVWVAGKHSGTFRYTQASDNTVWSVKYQDNSIREKELSREQIEPKVEKPPRRNLLSCFWDKGQQYQIQNDET